MNKETNIKSYQTKYIWLLVYVLSFGYCHAQQDSQYTQYMYNTQVINPAYAGSRGMLSLNGLHRTQWVGLEGAPRTFSFSLNSPIGNKGIGLGMAFIRDEIGPSIENNIAIDFSYTIQTSEKTKLSFGLKGGLNILDVNYDKLAINDPNDPDFRNNINSRTSPMVGVGFYWYNDNTWYIGLSSPNLLRTSHYDDNQVTEVTEEMHAYLMGGYVFELSESVKFKPALLVKAITESPLAIDVSANFLFNEKFTLGAAYRFDAAISGLVALQASDKLMIGYAYDYDTTELGNYNSGSHEIFLRFEFFTKVRSTVNPRFF
ncbi:conserved hypothetical protein [Tenacibaculum sediminilitoris]|uniref:PorP/SprF family type IX secretion system membrane protein n=1 Tax=Tenacibaculum sediminilitoris TaxID=1820334 RepID=UPI003894D640